jgi:hypothetical protein
VDETVQQSTAKLIFVVADSCTSSFALDLVSVLSNNALELTSGELEMEWRALRARGIIESPLAAQRGVLWTKRGRAWKAETTDRRRIHP